MSCRAPGATLDPLIVTWETGRVIHVMHDAAYPPESFNPGSGQLRRATRFAPFRNESGAVVPYLYGGSTLDCAIFETVFHEVLRSRGHGQVVPRRDLRLVDLTSDGLHRLKVPKEELIMSPSRFYGETARWAEALHRQIAALDGLLWMSRQRDRDQAVMLFGDRVNNALEGIRMPGGPLATSARLREAVLRAAFRCGIVAN